MNNFLTLVYWFNINPGPWQTGISKMLYIVFSLFLLVGLVAIWFKNKNKRDTLMFKFWNKIQAWGLTIGFVGAGLVFMRAQGVIFFAMPFLLLLNVIGAMLWAYLIWNYIVKVVPKRRKEQRAKEEREKYLK